MQYGAKVHIVNFGNDGLTRSKGLDVAKGEYVLFMDDDDWWLHEFVLEQIDNELKELSNPDVLAFSFVFNSLNFDVNFKSNSFSPFKALSSTLIDDFLISLVINS
jgi:glycosyltransferase involved in cell wall biosynthesis